MGWRLLPTTDNVRGLTSFCGRQASFFSVAQPFAATIAGRENNEAPLMGLLFSVRLVYPGVNAWATEKLSLELRYRNCLGGGGFFESSEEDVLPVSANISLIVPTAESIVEVSTGMKITLALLLFVISRKLSM